MNTQISQVLFYALIPTISMFLGGLMSIISAPSNKVASYTQHFAAGVVFAAVALELIPKVSQGQSPIPLTIGFLSGLTLMLLIKELAGSHGHQEESSIKSLPLSMLVGFTVDLIIDGLLIGLSFIAGNRGGILVTIALTCEILFLGFATGSSLRKQSPLKTLFIISFMASTVLLGALLGINLLKLLPAEWLIGVLSFGIAALLYLVTEELLVEAHHDKDTPLITSAFFVGFLVILLIDTHI